jgi:hypothetical protein
MDDFWLCEWTETRAISNEKFEDLKDFKTAKLYSATVKRFIEYWTNIGMKVMKVKSEEENKSILVEKCMQGWKDKGIEKVLKEYKAVMCPINFIGVTSKNDKLTREAVYAGIEFLGITWMEEIMKEMKISYDSIRWKEVIEEVREDMYWLELDPENLGRLSGVIKEVCRKANATEFDLETLADGCLNAIFLEGSE